MPATKSSTEVLMSLQQTIKHVWDCIADMMLRLGYLCEHIEWKDEVGIHFKEQYHENMKVVTERILPMFDRYNLFLNQLIEIVDDYTSAERGNADIAATLVSSLPPRNEYPSADDPDFQKEAEERIKRIAEYAEFPRNQQDFFNLDKHDLKRRLEDAMRREDSIAYHQYRLRNPESKALELLKKETKIVPTDQMFVTSENPARFVPSDNNIYVDENFYNNTDNMTLFSAIMHEYEHKQQFFAVLRGEVSGEAWMETHPVSDECLLQYHEHRKSGMKMEGICIQQLVDYKNDAKEKRSFKAQEITENIYNRR